MPEVILTGMVEKEDHHFVSHCVGLGIASCGDRVEEAFDMFEDAIEVYLEELVDIGTLDREFRECGVTARENLPSERDEVTLLMVPGRFYQAYVIKIPTLAAVRRVQ